MARQLSASVCPNLDGLQGCELTSRPCPLPVHWREATRAPARQCTIIIMTLRVVAALRRLRTAQGSARWIDELAEEMPAKAIPTREVRYWSPARRQKACPQV